MDSKYVHFNSKSDEIKDVCLEDIENSTLETCEINDPPTTPLGSKHLSKSASELSSPREMPEVRPRSAASPGTSSHLSVYQKTHSFFTQLKSRWARSKSKERRHKSPGRQDSIGTDYAADLSSDHSTPSTQSPRHRLHTYTGQFTLVFKL
ncbi:hypothetical protein FQA39_LY13399 [Lamprigera yunnana]|nr:hypothetical protein FQA39_LY13399 [Lamprigera yunnana]